MICINYGIVFFAAAVVFELGDGTAASATVVDEVNGAVSVVDNGVTPSDDATSDAVIYARDIASCKRILISFLNSKPSNLKNEYIILTYAVFVIAADADKNADADAIVTKVNDSTATAADSGGGENSDDAIVATAADVESDFNAVITVVVAYNAKFGRDLQNLIRT